MSREEYTPGSEIGSLVATLYKSWEEFEVPAIHYHYLLAILANKSKHQQTQIMARQVTKLRKGNDSYHLIKPWIRTRQAALESIKAKVSLICSTTNSDPHDAKAPYQEEVLDESGNGYRVVFESRSRMEEPRDNLQQFILNLRTYRKATMESIFQIYQWQKQLKRLGYLDLVQFMYNREDYFERLQHDTVDIIESYSFLFENNMFLLLQKHHKYTEYALIYQQLRLLPQAGTRYLEALSIVQNHHRDSQRHRLLRSTRHQPNTAIIRKAQSLRNLFVKNKSVASVYMMKSTLNQAMGNKVDIKVNRNPETVQSSQKWRSLIKVTDFGSKKLNTIKLVPIEHLIQGAETEAQSPSRNKQSLSISERTIPSKITQRQVLEDNQGIQRLNSEKLTFCYEKCLEKNQIYSYLKSDIFRHSKKDSQVEQLTKLILRHKDQINLITVKAGQLQVAWMAVCFYQKDKSLKKTVDVKAIHQFMKIPNFRRELEAEFGNKGYQLLTIFDSSISIKDVSELSFTRLVDISFKIGRTEESFLKRFIKEEEMLKWSRVLKYYTYSQASKYHKFCDHRSNECRLSFEVEEISKINVGGKTYIRAKCDSIIKKGKVWQVQQKINQLRLLFASCLNDLIEHNKLSDIDFHSSFEQQQDNQSNKQYLCLPDVRMAKRYTDESGHSVIVQHLKISCLHPEISIKLTEADVGDCLILSRPLFGALACKDSSDDGKLVALFSID